MNKKHLKQLTKHINKIKAKTLLKRLETGPYFNAIKYEKPEDIYKSWFKIYVERDLLELLNFACKE